MVKTGWPLWMFVLFFLAGPCYASDFTGEFIEENYRETQAPFSYDPIIYHSIQVNTNAGPKIIVLEGRDPSYRKWLRHFIASDKRLIFRVDDAKDDEFITAKVFSMDVTRVHPIAAQEWDDIELGRSNTEVVAGSNNILVVDAHPHRSQLIKSIIEKMGYQAVLFEEADQAIKPFTLQPGKFRMIITHYQSIGLDAGNFIDQILKIDKNIPVLIDTGYRNNELKTRFTNRFSEAASVFVKPVILQELSQIIQKLI